MQRGLYASYRLYSSVPVTAFHPTIYALSTSPGQRSAIAVVRVTGSHCKHIYYQLTGAQSPPVPRRCSLRNLYHAAGAKKNLLDSSLVLFFENPKSFTGEDMLELHLHGGRAVIKSVLGAIQSLGDQKKGLDIRYAQPGEFSQRAFQNGRMDLTQAEGVADLIDAETETQRRSALQSFRGQNKVLFDGWRSQIVSGIAQLTAIIDFGEDAEIEDTQAILDSVRRNMMNLDKEIKLFVLKIRRSSILQNGVKVALLGSPNAGKSSLLNCITNDDTSIVSDTPGTTRDAIDVPIDVDGYKVVLCDTAGIRSESEDQIEIQGIKRAKAKGSESDLVILVIDPTKTPLVTEDLQRFVKEQIPHNQVIIAVNKTDLVDTKRLKNVRQEVYQIFNGDFPIKSVSCTNFEGIENLVKELSHVFQGLSGTSHDSDPLIVSNRTEEILTKDVMFGLQEFLSFPGTEDVVMACENLAYAAEGIGKITGASVGVEEVLGVVFSRFCVGK
ncbi:TrmE-type G domain-containing protein [Lachancea thermotolerans]